MWQLLIGLYSEDEWWNPLLYLALMVVSGLSYQRYQRRSSILDDLALTKGLSKEQRLRLELGLMDASPVTGIDPIRPEVIDDRRAINAAVRDAIHESRERERGRQHDLKPAELARLRTRMDAILRTRWEQLATALLGLLNDREGADWQERLAGEGAIASQVADLDSEVRAAKQQPTYPAIALQLEGPLFTLREVVGHALDALEADTDPFTAAKLRESVLHFVNERLPGICDNIQQTAGEGQPEIEPAVKREVVLGNELTSQDLPSI